MPTGGYTTISLGTIGTFAIIGMGSYSEQSRSLRLAYTNGHRASLNSYKPPDAGMALLTPLPIIAVYDEEQSPPNLAAQGTVTITYTNGATLVGPATVVAREYSTAAHNQLLLWPFVVQFLRVPVYTPVG